MKRLLTILTILTLVLSATAPALAADGAPAISVEKAIGLAKAAFSVPDECDQFTSNYEEYNGNQTWSLTWRTKDGAKAVYISVDAATGAIRNYWRSQPESGPRSRLPKITREQGKAIADALIARLQPSESSQVRYLEPTYQPVYDLPIYATYRWNYSYERMVNGIPFPENTFNVQINGTTGEVESYSFNWDAGAVFPALDGKLDTAAANAVFGDKVGLKPIWWRPSPENNVGKPLRLVFTAPGAGKMIDAITGEIYETRFWFGRGTADEAMKSMAPAPQGKLTPAEQVAVDELAKYISIETAEQAARKALGIGAEYRRTGANLVQDWEFPENSKRWTFSFAANENTENARWASAEVDALTGSLLNFYLPYPDEMLRGKTEPTYTRDQAKAVAEAYIKSLDAAKAAEVQFVPPTYKIDDTNAIDYTFDFVRVHDGYEFPSNSFSVTVCAYDNKVFRASLRWADLEFPNVDAALTKAAAEAKVLAAYPLKLTYQTVTKDGSQMIRPVYFFDAISTSFDGFTAEPIDWRGEVVKTYVKPAFTDIKGSAYEAEIQILIDLGAIDSTATAYRPNDTITTAEFLKLLTSVVSDTGRPRPLAGEAWSKAYIDAARDSDFVLPGETISEGKAVTRADAARWLVRALDLEYVGKLSNIYQLPSGDSKVTADRGYLAIAWGLNILRQEGTSLKPLQTVTRGEAAALIVRMLRVEK
ncbi:MAG: YcdB/YcdC domain-containing protein [Chloroflexota bacterium]